MLKSEPIVCTLTDDELQSRKVTWQDVVQKSVTSATPIDRGYILTLDVEHSEIEELRELVNAESKCCRWMHLALDEHAMRLSITSDSVGGAAVIGRMLGVER